MFSDHETIDFGDGPAIANRSELRLRGRQAEWLNTMDADLNFHTRTLVVAPGGVGKCLGKGTPVLMFDGTIKAVEDVIFGDLLMGPDSNPRRVISTCTGSEMLYRVTPRKGMSYVVNESHVLSLKATCGAKPIYHNRRKLTHGEVVNMPVGEYLSSCSSFKHSSVGWRTGVDAWGSKLHRDMPPYILGVWLGDGTTGRPQFHGMDMEILNEVAAWADSIDCLCTIVSDEGKCPRANIRSKNQGWFVNRMVIALKELGIYQRKAIPQSYKTASRSDRLELLAGLIDTDGHASSGCYDFISIYQEMSEDVAFIARSLGFAAYVRPCYKKCQTGNGGIYHRVSISGDLAHVPSRLHRKIHAARKQCKNVLHVGIKVEPIGIGEYFGFQIAGSDGLFLLGDFTVTHNTTLFAALAARYESRGKKTLVLENRDKLTRQTAKRIADETGLQVDIEMADEHASPFAPIVVASVQSMGRVNRLTGFSDTHFDLIIPDEAHFSLAPQWARVLNYFHYGAASLDPDWKRPDDGTYIPQARVVGFTATPDIGERKNLGEFYQHRSVNYSYLEAVNDGWLVGPVQKNIPVRVDLKKYKVQHTTHGNDFKAQDLEEAMIPIIEELAEQTAIEAGDRKTIAFMPSVKCARLMVDALLRRGMQAWLAAGDEEATEENTAAFTEAGRGSVLVNAQIYVYGVDFPDVDCIAWYRATISRAFYIQGLYRASRILLPKGVLEACPDADARKAAIAASTKPNFLILDPLFVSDRIDLLDAYDLFTDKPEVKAKMKAVGDLTPEAAEKAERDFIKTLEKEAKKHARKAARTIDPLAIAVSLGDASIRDYVPQPGWESAPPTQGQIDFIRRQGIAVDHIRYKGLASKIIGRLMNRLKHNLATAGQLSFMLQLGVEEQTAAKLSQKEATELIDRTVAQKRERTI